MVQEGWCPVNRSVEPGVFEQTLSNCAGHIEPPGLELVTSGLMLPSSACCNILLSSSEIAIQSHIQVFNWEIYWNYEVLLFKNIFVNFVNSRLAN